MPAINSDIDISLSLKKHKSIENWSFFVLTIKSNKDKNFHYQIVSLTNNKQTLDLQKLNETLKKYLYFSKSNNELIFHKKKDFLNYLKELHFDPRATKIIEIKDDIENCFKLNEAKSKTEQEIDKNVAELFIILDNINKTACLAVQKPKDFYNNNLFTLCVLTNSKKLYLFPTDAKNYKIIIDRFEKNQLCLTELEILSLEFSSDREVNIKIYKELQKIIAKTIAHLKKTKFFGKAATDKIEIFLALANKISNKESLTNIKNFLNRYNKVKILSKHRDPWGIFAFFKGETYSAFVWNELSNMLLDTPIPSIEIRFPQ